MLPSELNIESKVALREKLLAFEYAIKIAGEQTQTDTSRDNFPVTHYFTPIEERFGCRMYAREIFIPAGHVLVGKIHRYPHLNFLLQGKIAIVTEFGQKIFTAPDVIISQEIGVKKAGYALEDTRWVTVHFSDSQDCNLDTIETEVVTDNYKELGLIDNIEELKRLELK